MPRVFGLAVLAFFLAYFQTANSSGKFSNTTGNESVSLKEKELSLIQNQDRLQTMDFAHNNTKPRNIQNVWRPLIKCPVEKSCVGRCTVKREFHQPKDKMKCYCDPFCDTVFHDCCADYDKECNASAMKENFTKLELDDLWMCTKVDKNRLSIWTVAKCKPTWKDEDIAKKCTSPNKLQISTQIPVTDNNNFTFRNRYCALCNGIYTYEPWIFTVKCNAMPTSVYSEAESWEFTDSFCESKLLDRKFSTRGIRYCYDVIKKCKKDALHSKHIKNCKEQRTGIVAVWSNFKNYKNMECLLCNSGSNIIVTCGPKLTTHTHKVVVPRPYSAIFTSSKENRFTSYSRCPASYIHDTRLGNCRKLFDASTKKNSQQQLQKFAIILQYDGTENGSYNTITKDVRLTRFNYVFEKLLKVSLIEMNLEYSDLDIQKQKNSSFFVTFQILGLKRNLENSDDTPFDYSKIGNLIFHASFNEDMKHGVSQYSLTRSATREMICAQNTTFVAVNRTTSFSNGTIFINQIQSYCNKGEFLRYNETFFVVCKEYKPTNCSYYNVLQKTNDWILLPNRSIHSHVTKSVFDYGEYSIIDSKAWVCLKDTLVVKANRIRVPSTSIHETILSYATLISLTVSVLSLNALIITYSLNRSLRNLPGKNLMLLCGTIALAQTLWLIERNISSSSVLCHMTAIGSHFAFLSSFCASGSIAIHSYLTFRRLAKGNLSLTSTKRHFLWYTSYSVLLPSVWVALCWILDSYQIILLRNEFSNSCWFGNSQGLKVAFLYPAAAQLFFNITLLFATLRHIHKCSTASLQLQEKTGATNRRCVGIYFRMSTLMGLSWLSGVFVVTFPHLVVFEYLFLFGNGFQGLYIALAFLLTKNVKKIMAKRFTTNTRSASQSSPCN